MHFYQQQHRFYCGIDLHARTMHLCVLDPAGSIRFDKKLPCRPDALREAVAIRCDGLTQGIGVSGGVAVQEDRAGVVEDA